MDFLTIAMALLGVALIIVLVYLAITGQALPPALKVVVLVAVALMFVLCLVGHFGCPPIATPQAVG